MAGWKVGSPTPSRDIAGVNTGAGAPSLGGAASAMPAPCVVAPRRETPTATAAIAIASAKPPRVVESLRGIVISNGSGES